MKQPDLYYFETTKMTSQTQSKFTENTRLRLVFSIQNLTRLVTSFLCCFIEQVLNIQILKMGQETTKSVGRVVTDKFSFYLFRKRNKKLVI